MNGGRSVPAGDWKSYAGILNAGSDPNPACEITLASTELSNSIAVVSDGAESEDEGLNTDSSAKKHPATAALNPDIPHPQCWYI